MVRRPLNHKMTLGPKRNQINVFLTLILMAQVLVLCMEVALIVIVTADGYTIFSLEKNKPWVLCKCSKQLLIYKLLVIIGLAKSLSSVESSMA